MCIRDSILLPQYPNTLPLDYLTADNYATAAATITEITILLYYRSPFSSKKTAHHISCHMWHLQSQLLPVSLFNSYPKLKTMLRGYLLETIHISLAFSTALFVMFQTWTLIMFVLISHLVLLKLSQAPAEHQALKCETLRAVCQCNSSRHCTIWSLVQATAMTVVDQL